MILKLVDFFIIVTREFLFTYVFNILDISYQLRISQQMKR